MNTTEHLLVCLGEEGSEVAQTTSKILRFGIDDVNVLNPTGPNNRERLILELNDLMAVADLLITLDVLPADWESPDLQKAKKEKVLKFMDYAVLRGTLHP